MSLESIGIFFSSTTGRTRKVAEMIALCIADCTVDLCPIAKHFPTDLYKFGFLIFGTPTYGQGDMHHDWLRWRPDVERLDLSKKQIALFALGDQKYHGKTFAGALKPMLEMVRASGAKPVGRWLATDYDFKYSPALGSDGHFPGLVIDEITQRNQTPVRVQKWCMALMSEANFCRSNTSLNNKSGEHEPPEGRGEAPRL